jgi:hypothetical protein
VDALALDLLGLFESISRLVSGDQQEEHHWPARLIVVRPRWQPSDNESWRRWPTFTRQASRLCSYCTLWLAGISLRGATEFDWSTSVEVD